MDDKELEELIQKETKELAEKQFLITSILSFQTKDSTSSGVKAE